ncbi:MAG: hypothetical protein Q7S29_00030 [Candidatus Peribacter sp.]|nr:hypothetical protein [Candidatus Peribacter sp.]
MDIPQTFQDLDARKLAHEGWGATVDIAEIMRQETLNTLRQFVHGLYMTETLRRAGGTLEQAATTLSKSYRQHGWSDTAVMLSMHLTQNLFRELPLDEFIARSPKDFLRRYALPDDGEIPEGCIDSCDLQEHDFWYGMLPEGRELIVTGDGLQRITQRVMEMENIAPEAVLNDTRKQETLVRTFEKQTRKVTEQAIRTVLAERLTTRSLLDRDRMIDSVHHIAMDAAFKLFQLLKSERGQSLSDDGREGLLS